MTDLRHKRSEEFPSRPVSIIVPYPVEGGSDLRARILARYLSQDLDQVFDVTNLTGAPEGHAAVARAAPDGHTLGLISTEIGMMRWKGASTLTFNDYTPIAILFNEPVAIIVRADSPYQTVPELLSHIRQSHRRLRAAGSPAYGIFRFAWTNLLAQQNIDPSRVEWVPTISAEVGVEKLMANEIEIAPVSLPEASADIRQGRARPLAIMNDTRHPSFGDVPTIFEVLGSPVVGGVWRGLVAPAKIPENVKRRLGDAVSRVAKNPDFIAESARNGYTLNFISEHSFSEQMRREDHSFEGLMKLIPNSL